jgi:uncharacterized protein (TIGR02391 family)
MNSLGRFERIVRKAAASKIQLPATAKEELTHPFDERNIHTAIANIARKLFDDGHYAQATFEAFKFLDKEVSRISGVKESGSKLMMQAFAESAPPIKLTPLMTTSEKDEQKGFQFMFAGATWGIRNPRGHEVGLTDPIDLCLDHLSVASVLMRRLEARLTP